MPTSTDTIDLVAGLRIVWCGLWRCQCHENDAMELGECPATAISNLMRCMDEYLGKDGSAPCPHEEGAVRVRDGM